jgi:hypothetical protein
VKTVAEYDVLPNPWHQWLKDNVPADLHEWIGKTQLTDHLVEKGQWTVAYQLRTLREYCDDNGLDYRVAGQAWADYEGFKADLSKYRLAKHGETS